MQYIAVYEKKKYFAVCDTNTSIGNYRRCILFTISRSYYISVIVCYAVFFIVDFISIKCVKRYLRKLKIKVKCVKWVPLLSIMGEKKYDKKLMFSYFNFFMGRIVLFSVGFTVLGYFASLCHILNIFWET